MSSTFTSAQPGWLVRQDSPHTDTTTIPLHLRDRVTRITRANTLHHRVIGWDTTRSNTISPVIYDRGQNRVFVCSLGASTTNGNFTLVYDPDWYRQAEEEDAAAAAPQEPQPKATTKPFPSSDEIGEAVRTIAEEWKAMMDRFRQASEDLRKNQGHPK